MPFTQFFDSIGVPNLQAILEQAILMDMLGKNRRDLAEEYIKLFDDVFLIQWQWQKAAMPPSWAFFRDLGGQGTLVISGTQEVKEILIHTAGCIPIGFATDRTPVHAGWYLAWQDIYHQVSPLWRVPPASLLITGHSYGGGVAVVAAACAGQSSGFAPPLPCDVMTFGSPRALFGFSNPTILPRIVRVTADRNDPVPFLPPRGLILAPGGGFVGKKAIGVPIHWNHAGYRVRFDSLGNVHFDGPADDESLVGSLVTDNRFSLPAHFMDAYVARAASYFRRFL